ncbi:MAG: hypothetical protein EOP49_33620, partial [Sphingobacteriales bacterium]
REFVDDADGQGKWFKTGDVAVRRYVDGAGKNEEQPWARGAMYFIHGRQSADIIKTGGEKVSALEIERDGKTMVVNPTITNDGKLGVYHFSYSSELDSLGILKIERRKYGFFEAFPAGVRMAIDNLIFYIDQFKKILSPETGAYKGVGGFKSMGSIFPKQWGDWQAFWTITAFFSIILAFMNLLPIPALDGGHVLFTLYEMVTGRKPNDKFLEYAQIVGMIFLLGLMLYANGNDWFGWNRNK